MSQHSEEKQSSIDSKHKMKHLLIKESILKLGNL